MEKDMWSDADLFLIAEFTEKDKVSRLILSNSAGEVILGIGYKNSSSLTFQDTLPVLNNLIEGKKVVIPDDQTYFKLCDLGLRLEDNGEADNLILVSDMLFALPFHLQKEFSERMSADVLKKASTTIFFFARCRARLRERLQKQNELLKKIPAEIIK